MSACISSKGEYSSHELDATFTCVDCGVRDEDAMLAEVNRLREENAKLAQDSRKTMLRVAREVANLPQSQHGWYIDNMCATMAAKA